MNTDAAARIAELEVELTYIKMLLSEAREKIVIYRDHYGLEYIGGAALQYLLPAIDAAVAKKRSTPAADTPGVPFDPLKHEQTR